MVRVKRGYVARHKRKKVLKRAKGFRGSLHRLFQFRQAGRYPLKGLRHKAQKKEERRHEVALDSQDQRRREGMRHHVRTG